MRCFTELPCSLARRELSEEIVALMSFDAESKNMVRKLKAVGRSPDWDGVEALIGSFPSPVTCQVGLAPFADLDFVTEHITSMEIGMFPLALNCLRRLGRQHISYHKRRRCSPLNWFGNGEFTTDNPFVKYCPLTTCA